MPCPQCKVEVGPADVFCISCGARLAPVQEAGLHPQASPATRGSPQPAAVDLDEDALMPRGAPRWPAVLLAVIVNLGLLAASAWLVYAALRRFSSGD